MLITGPHRLTLLQNFLKRAQCPRGSLTGRQACPKIQHWRGSHSGSALSAQVQAISGEFESPT